MDRDTREFLIYALFAFMLAMLISWPLLTYEQPEPAIYARF